MTKLKLSRAGTPAPSTLQAAITEQEDVGRGATLIRADISNDSDGHPYALLQLLRKFNIVYILTSFGTRSPFFPQPQNPVLANALHIDMVVAPKKY